MTRKTLQSTGEEAWVATKIVSSLYKLFGCNKPQGGFLKGIIEDLRILVIKRIMVKKVEGSKEMLCHVKCTSFYRKIHFYFDPLCLCLSIPFIHVHRIETTIFYVMCTVICFKVQCSLYRSLFIL